MPSVSVITPLYNGADHIEACIASVAAQSFTDLEHIVIDNNSTDDGPERVAALCRIHPHLRLIYESQKGAGPARNAGIHAAQGRYIAFLDADDSWKPEKLERQIAAMKASGAVFSWTAYDIYKDDSFVRMQQAAETLTYDDLLAKRSTIGCLTAIYDSEILGKVFMNDLPMRQDFCLWLDILAAAERDHHAVIGLRQPLADYHVHANGLTSNKLKAARGQWTAYRSHVGLSRTRTLKLFASYVFHALAVRIRGGFVRSS